MSSTLLEFMGMGGIKDILSLIGQLKNEDGNHYPVAGTGRPVFSSFIWINLPKIRSKMRSQR